MKQRQNRSQKTPSSSQDLRSHAGLATAIVAVIGLICSAYRFFTRYQRNIPKNVCSEERRLNNLILLGKDGGALMEPDLKKVDYPITFKMLKVPVKTKACTHFFEEEEICDWVRSKDYCPECFGPLKRKDLVKVYKY